MKTLDNLPAAEKMLLLQYPAYITLLAANQTGELDRQEKKSAIRFSHIRTYSCDPLLTEFYKEAEKVFIKNLETLDQCLPKGMSQRETAIQDHLVFIQNIVLKLGEEYAGAMNRSMRSFKQHVSKAHHSVLVDFIFPLRIKGLND